MDVKFPDGGTTNGKHTLPIKISTFALFKGQEVNSSKIFHN